MSSTMAMVHRYPSAVYDLHLSSYDVDQLLFKDVLRSSFRSTAASPEPLTKSPDLQKIPRCYQTEQFYPFCLVQAKKSRGVKAQARSCPYGTQAQYLHGGPGLA
ncbi:hypothetical protein TWF173_008354 [Orbilia oligospora]|uniref:Uncharacterized protein n=1 Tax=Orbilia oligospora TaxID=2813651 RepID=A0A7C8RH50_ORBOL|nr:hypothetical protein TWF970_003516 [Orbilia oligospora]KAF3311373.1 hypothetical protein TWF173_008354 [Orbilia oligospora]